jgi:hypothetical protein
LFRHVHARVLCPLLACLLPSTVMEALSFDMLPLPAHSLCPNCALAGQTLFGVAKALSEALSCPQSDIFTWCVRLRGVCRLHAGAHASSMYRRSLCTHARAHCCCCVIYSWPRSQAYSTLFADADDAHDDVDSCGHHFFFVICCVRACVRARVRACVNCARACYRSPSPCMTTAAAFSPRSRTRSTPSRTSWASTSSPTSGSSATARRQRRRRLRRRFPLAAASAAASAAAPAVVVVVPDPLVVVVVIVAAALAFTRSLVRSLARAGLDENGEKRGWPHIFAQPKAAGLPLGESDVLFAKNQAAVSARACVRVRACV